MNYNEKSLVKVDNSIFSRIKLFFRNLFSSKIQKKTNYVEEVKETEKRNIQENNFITNIKISEKKQSLRVQRMSKDLESGEIEEEDLCEQELQELREFYVQKIEDKKQSIENCKKRIMAIKAQLA